MEPHIPLGVPMTPSNISPLHAQSTEGFYNSKVIAPAALPVRTFLPTQYEPNYAYPLLVFFHGHGSNEDHVLRYAPYISRRNFIAISLRGIEKATRKSASAKGNYSWGQDGCSEMWVEDYLFNAIEKTQNSYNIHPNRIYLAGFCEGAAMAYRMAVQFPDRFAGVLSMNGALPRTQKPLWRVQQMRDLKVFIGHGIANSVIPMSMACQDRQSFQTAGIDPFWRTYATNHRIHLDMLKDANRWIMSNIEKSLPGSVHGFKG